MTTSPVVLAVVGLYLFGMLALGLWVARRAPFSRSFSVTSGPGARGRAPLARSFPPPQ